MPGRLIPPPPPEPRHARVERMAWELLLACARGGIGRVRADHVFDLAEAFLNEADRRAADEALGKGEK